MPSTTSSSLLCATLLLASTAVHGQYTNGYKPTNVTCPSRSLIRNAGTNAANNQTVNPDEASYIQRRKQQVVAQAFQDYLGSDNATGYDLQAIAPNATYWPTVGIAVSGGGYRAALVGAGNHCLLGAPGAVLTAFPLQEPSRLSMAGISLLCKPVPEVSCSWRAT